MSIQRIGEAGLELIKKFESFEDDWYFCPANKKTIGYGHVYQKGDDFTTPITEEFAATLLQRDAGEAEQAVCRSIKVPLTQNQFDALASLAFNIGGRRFSGSSLVRELNNGNLQAAADQFLVWRKGGGKILPGLVRRRTAERALFLEDAA
jgi:lysozyme